MRSTIGTTSRPQLEIFYGISSPWAYLGAQRGYEIADRTGATLMLRPIRVIEANGGIPLRTRPLARQNYHAIELERRSKFLGIPLKVTPRHYPCRTIEPAAISIVALVLAGIEARDYSFAVQRALWAEDRDIADLGTLRQIARDTLGDRCDGLDFANPARNVVNQWRDNLQEAERRGIFGTPTYVVGDQLFWGQDRLDFVERALVAQCTSDHP